MSIKIPQRITLTPRHTGIISNVASEVAAWLRNPSWKELPTVVNTEQKYVGLHAVWEASTYVALAANGAYTVDWGDGVVENIANGIQANHLYDFTDPDLANTNAPVTLVDAGDLVQRTAHGYSNGMTVSLYNIVTTTGVTAGQIYYVINATANDFQVSATSGGASLPLTGDGTATLLPYKQAIVTVTPQAGQNLTSLNLNVKNNAQAGLQAYATGWLDILVSGPSLASLTISGNPINIYHDYLEQAQLISSNGITSFAYMFNNCYSLQSVPSFNTAAATSMNSMFNGCYALQTVPLFNTASVTSMSNMFVNCYALQTIPALTTTAVTSSANFSSMFSSCYSLAKILAGNFRFTFSVASCKLSETALNEIYTNLPTVTSQTITVTGNYGTTSDNPAIATAKGWTVTG